MAEETVSSMRGIARGTREHMARAGGIEEAFQETPKEVPKRVGCMGCGGDRSVMKMSKKALPYFNCPDCSVRVFLNGISGLNGYRILSPSAYRLFLHYVEAARSAHTNDRTEAIENHDFKKTSEGREQRDGVVAG
jgi:hypothetical protein